MFFIARISTVKSVDLRLSFEHAGGPNTCLLYTHFPSLLLNRLVRCRHSRWVAVVLRRKGNARHWLCKDYQQSARTVPMQPEPLPLYASTTWLCNSRTGRSPAGYSGMADTIVRPGRRNKRTIATHMGAWRNVDGTGDFSHKVSFRPISSTEVMLVRKGSITAIFWRCFRAWHAFR